MAEVWKDSQPNKLVNAGVAVAGYLFFWSTELVMLYLLVREVDSKGGLGFPAAAGLALGWTVAAAYATLRLQRLTRQVRTLYLTEDAIGFSGKNATEIPLAEVEKIIVAQADEGFQAIVTAQETHFAVQLRDRRGFIEACKKVSGLKGRVASTGLLD